MDDTPRDARPGAGEEAPNSIPNDLRDIVRSRVAHLRARLLDSSRRNPLIQIPFRQNSSSLIRIVDELPDVLAERLADQQPMRLKALPPIDDPLPDENTDAFLEALEIARTTDAAFKAESDALDPTDPDYAQKELDIERALKDRVRAELGLPERQTDENPSLADHARAHGICPDYVLPLPDDAHEDGRHGDDDIQTLLLPERLERVGRSLHDRGHAFERETGVNVLHAAFGVLEWNEPGATRGPARSPLLLLEVRMTRQKGPSGAEYRIRGETEITVNTTLAQTLAAEHGLELPPYEGGSVEAYFAAVAGLAPKGWHWSLRREALVGVFPSSRIAMYHDLDPEKAGVADHPIVTAMLASAGGEGGLYADVYETDDPDTGRRVPHLVLDADASQLSSLVDVANGGNLAIEGPPGSGKSQTIVNLIAAALADGKKVLFVAEKLTALDVVRNRLEAAGLGEFILPLQAGRGSRDAVFQSLEDRLALERPRAGAAEAHARGREALTQRRAALQGYLDMLGSPLGRTGLTVHEALGQAIATADHLDGLPREIRKLRLPSPETLDGDARKSIDGDARMVVERLGDADRMAPLWREARQAPLRSDEAEELATDIGGLAEDIAALRAETAGRPLAALMPQDPIRADADTTLSALEAISASPEADPALVATLRNTDLRAAAEALCEARAGAASARETLDALLADPEAEDVDATIAAADALAGRHGGAVEPGRLAEEIATQEARLEALRRFRTLATALPARWAETAAEEGTTLADLRLDIERLLRVPQAVLDRRVPDEGRTLPAAAREAAATQRQLAATLDTIRHSLPQAGPHDAATLHAAATAIEGAGLFRAFSGRYKAARALFRDTLGGSLKAGRPSAALALRDYAQWARKRDAFVEDARLKAALGALHSGLDSDPENLEAVAGFHERIGELARGDDRLRYALEAGPLEPLQAFAAETEMAALTLTELDAEIARMESGLEPLRADQAEAAALCQAFAGGARLDAETISRAREARQALGSAQAAIAGSPAASTIPDVVETDAVRTAILLADRIEHLPDPEAGLDVLRRGEGAQRLAEARAFFAEHGELAEDAKGIAEELAFIGIDTDAPLAALHALADRIDDLLAAAQNPEGLLDRARLLRALTALGERGLGELATWIQTEAGRPARARLPDIVAALVARSMTDHVEQVFGRTLDAHDGADLDRLRREIAGIDRELVQLSRHVIRDTLLTRSRPPVGNGTGKVASYTEMSLIRHELGKSRNRIGVRNLTARAGAALAELKPCWMLSPLAVAQYLHGTLAFDLVVIDEASQMTPENALGAIKRARQVVVVGDTKQLPPTSFFSKVLDDADEDEDARTDSESILDMANTTFTPVRQLRWHYRSRHPDLIAISNKMVYDSQLTIFPAARDADPSLGVDLIEVEGSYVSGRNIPEARAIVAGAVEHMRRHPDRSLGLATMNKQQTELILSEFERERARHPHVDDYIDTWAERDDGLEEFFVKNLETIQGDERDVIMISTLYGPDPETGRSTSASAR